MVTPRGRVLVVDDDAAIRRVLAATLEEEGYGVVTAATAEEALARLGEGMPDVILSDVRMPGMTGIELLKLVRERAPSVDLVLMTAFEDLETVAVAMREGAFDFLVKPLELSQLREVLERVFDDRRARQVMEDDGGGPAAGFGVETLIGRHPRMIEVYKQVGRLAASRVNALILGETGSGKERVARAIHFTSPDAGEPFIALNCAALPEALLESELFGHVRGAFTGAVSDRRGRFSLAGRGTIFLDEIGDTTPGFQAKLLRVLEAREFYPLGAERLEGTEARVIAATNRHLEELVVEGRFREDLYYRLRVMEIVLPPLRERLSDLPLLAHHFVQKAATELGRPAAHLPRETVTALLRHDWPGNVRELENCLTRAVVVAAGNVIRPEHLQLRPGMQTEDGEIPSLEEMERVHLERALTAAQGNRTRAAEILGVSKPRLYRMLQKHAIR